MKTRRACQNAEIQMGSLCIVSAQYARMTQKKNVYNAHKKIDSIYVWCYNMNNPQKKKAQTYAECTKGYRAESFVKSPKKGD